MSRRRVAFLIAVAGGLVGYACGAALNPTSATAQQGSVAADAGPSMPPGTGGGTASSSGGSPGQVPTPACAQWEIKLGAQVRSFDAQSVPQGWEPFAWSQTYGGEPVLRRCIR